LLLTVHHDAVGADALELAADGDEVVGVARLGQARPRLLQVRRALPVGAHGIAQDPSFTGLGADCEIKFIKILIFYNSNNSLYNSSRQPSAGVRYAFQGFGESQHKFD
jgi:hypothetical protein